MLRMSPLEAIACALGIVCVTLVVLRRIANYPFGIASVALYSVVFFEAKLYSDALLQLFYVAVNAYGWWAWTRNKASEGEVVVEAMDWPWRLQGLAGIAVAAALWGGLMHRFTDASYPWVDAIIAIASVAAQILMARRRIENWWLWIAVDLASVPLYAAKGLTLTMGLYVIYLALAVWGLIDWHRAWRRAGPVVA